MRTTITLDDDVAAAVEAERRKEGRSLREIVNAALRNEFARKAQPQRRQVVRTRAVSLGGCRFPNLDNVAEVLAVAEGESFR
jgi:hypothetical protein